jgi:hypothetical protein
MKMNKRANVKPTVTLITDDAGIKVNPHNLSVSGLARSDYLVSGIFDKATSIA